jgi:hypothetical protein
MVPPAKELFPFVTDKLIEAPTEAVAVRPPSALSLPEIVKVATESSVTVIVIPAMTLRSPVIYSLKVAL